MTMEATHRERRGVRRCERNVFQSTRTARTRRPVQRRHRHAGRDRADASAGGPMTSNSNAADRSAERQATASASAACTAPSPVPRCAMSSSAILRSGSSPGSGRLCVASPRTCTPTSRSARASRADQRRQDATRFTPPLGAYGPGQPRAARRREAPGRPASSEVAVEHGQRRRLGNALDHVGNGRDHNARPEEHGHELARTLRVVGTSHANGRRRVTGVDRMRCRICVDRSGWTSAGCLITRRAV